MKTLHLVSNYPSPRLLLRHPQPNPKNLLSDGFSNNFSIKFFNLLAFITNLPSLLQIHGFNLKPTVPHSNPRSLLQSAVLHRAQNTATHNVTTDPANLFSIHTILTWILTKFSFPTQIWRLLRCPPLRFRKWVVTTTTFRWAWIWRRPVMWQLQKPRVWSFMELALIWWLRVVFGAPWTWGIKEIGSSCLSKILFKTMLPLIYSAKRGRKSLIRSKRSPNRRKKRKKLSGFPLSTCFLLAFRWKQISIQLFITTSDLMKMESEFSFPGSEGLKESRALFQKVNNDESPSLAFFPIASFVRGNSYTGLKLLLASFIWSYRKDFTSSELQVQSQRRLRFQLLFNVVDNLIWNTWKANKTMNQIKQIQISNIFFFLWLTYFLSSLISSFLILHKRKIIMKISLDVVTTRSLSTRSHLSIFLSSKTRTKSQIHGNHSRKFWSEDKRKIAAYQGPWSHISDSPFSVHLSEDSQSSFLY